MTLPRRASSRFIAASAGDSVCSGMIRATALPRWVMTISSPAWFHKEKRLSLSSDLPIMLSVIDEEAKILAYLPILEQMVQEGLVVLSDVDVIKYTHRLESSVESKEQSS